MIDKKYIKEYKKIIDLAFELNEIYKKNKKYSINLDFNGRTSGLEVSKTDDSFFGIKRINVYLDNSINNADALIKEIKDFLKKEIELHNKS